jgi:hypothetical protein
MTPKQIILDALKSKFEGTGFTKIILNFNVINESYNVMLKAEKAKDLSINIPNKEMTMIKLMFINKIKHKYQKDYNTPLKCIIVSVDFISDVFEIFTENEKGNVYKFEY